MIAGIIRGLAIALAVVFFIGVYLFGNKPEIVGNWVGNRIGDVAGFFGGMGGVDSTSGTILVKVD